MMWDSKVMQRTFLALAVFAAAACGSSPSKATRAEGTPNRQSPDSSSGAIASSTASSKGPVLAANHEGRIPVLEYHLIGDKDSRWGRSRDSFRKDLELLYERGYRPMTVGQMLAKDFSAIPPGKSPVI